MIGCLNGRAVNLKFSLVSTVDQWKGGILTGRFTAVAVFATFEPTRSINIYLRPSDGQTSLRGAGNRAVDDTISALFFHIVNRHRQLRSLPISANEIIVGDISSPVIGNKRIASGPRYRQV